MKKNRREKLTAANALVLGVLAAHLHADHAPTLAELAADVGLESPSTVRAHIDKLIRLGFVHREAQKARGLSLTPRGDALFADDPAEVARACLAAVGVEG